MIPAKVLVVDDLPENQISYRAALEEPGVQVVSAMSGREALKAILQHDFAVILLDVNMPGMDGFETAALIRRRKRSAHTPIIFVTAHLDDAFAARCYAEGGVDFLFPVSPDVLRTKVGVFVNLFRLAEQVKEQAEQRVARAEVEQARLTAILETAADFVGSADKHGTIRHINRAGRRMLGCDDARVPAADRMPDIELPDWGLSAARRDGVWFGDTSLPHTSGKSVPVSLVILAHRNDDLQVESFSVIAHDITERCRAEEAIQRLAAERAILLDSERSARAEAERLGRLKDEFLANLSHELRTPLNAILGWATLLQGPGATAEDIEEGLEIIVKNAGIQSRLIADLLDVHRILSGKLRLDLAPVELHKILHDVIDTLQPHAAAKQIRVHCDSPPTNGDILADANRIQQVVWNLVTNAIKFSPSGSTVVIELNENDKESTVTVTDSGEGIDPEFLPHLFQKFCQADGSAARRHGGLGLGLAIAKHLVELQGGWISASSEGPGKGACFTFALPKMSQLISSGEQADGGPSAIAAQLSTNEMDLSRLKGLQVLVVDDDPEAAALTQRILQDHEVEVSVAHSAAEALDHLSRAPVQVLVSDLGMPIEDGYTLVRRIRRMKDPAIASLPAVALTAFARPEDRKRSIEAGYQAHVTKPLHPWELLGAITSVCDAAEAREERWVHDPAANH